MLNNIENIEAMVCKTQPKPGKCSKKAGTVAGRTMLNVRWAHRTKRHQISSMLFFRGQFYQFIWTELNAQRPCNLEIPRKNCLDIATPTTNQHKTFQPTSPSRIHTRALNRGSSIERKIIACNYRGGFLPIGDYRNRFSINISCDLLLDG